VTLWSIRHIPGKSDYFAVAGGDGTVSVWNQKKLDAPSSKLNLSKHPVTSLDWNQDKKGLFACTSFDQTIKLGMVNGV
jgi:WD40 repeat protein